jgi:hypothetical protein
MLENVYAAHVDDPDFALFELRSEAIRVGYAAARLIYDTGVPLLRRYLEGVLVHVGGFSPRAVYAVLDDWRTYLPNTIFVDEIEGGPESNSHVYGLRPLTDSEREHLTDLVSLRREVLNKDRLGDWGEIYVRACFKRSRTYSRVTRKRRLGHAVAAPGTNRADMLVTETATGERWAISVRNRKKVLEPRSDWIADCLEMAETNNAKPWIIPSFATHEAVAACIDQGMRCAPIGARVMPAEDELKRPMRLKVAELYPVIGGEPFTFMGKNRLLEAEPNLIGLLRSA